MTTRREFLGAAAAAAAVPALAGVARAAPRALLIQPRIVVVDSRFADARSFGRRWSEHDVPVREFTGDMGRLWNSELRRIAAQEPGPIVGLTARPALFLLEQLAAQHKMSIVFHAEHARSTQGELRHVVFQTSVDLSADDLMRTGESWPAGVALALQGFPLPQRSERPAQSGMTCTPEEGMEILASWVFAPIGAVV